MNYGLYLFVLTVCYGITLIHYYFRGHYYAMRVRVALSSIIYRKVWIFVTVCFVSYPNLVYCIVVMRSLDYWIPTDCFYLFSPQIKITFILGSTFIPKVSKWNFIWKVGQFTVKRCTPILFVDIFASIVDCSRNDNYFYVHFISWNSMGWGIRCCHHSSICTNSE